MRIFLSVIVLSVFQVQLCGQISNEIAEWFNEGEYFFNRQDFQEAAYYYKRIVEQQRSIPISISNLECYLNMPVRDTGHSVTKNNSFNCCKNKYKRKNY
jgi:hypothetical protein